MWAKSCEKAGESLSAEWLDFCNAIKHMILWFTYLPDTQKMPVWGEQEVSPSEGRIRKVLQIKIKYADPSAVVTSSD